jgi:hypothetical protein
MMSESRKQIREIKHLIYSFNSKPDELKNIINNFYDIRAIIESESYNFEGI